MEIKIPPIVLTGFLIPFETFVGESQPRKGGYEPTGLESAQRSTRRGSLRVVMAEVSYQGAPPRLEELSCSGALACIQVAAPQDTKL